MSAPPPPPKPLSSPGLTEASVPARRIPRVLEFALFLTALIWAVAASLIAGRGAQGLTLRFNVLATEPLLEAVFLLFLAVVGFRALDWVATRGVHRAEVLALPRRATRGAEWGSGAALGWGLALACALPMLVTLNLHSHLAGRVGPVALALVTLLAATLAQEVVFRGYPFQRLSDALGPTAATLVLSFVFAGFLFGATPSNHGLLALAGEVLLGVLLSMAWLRTHALWVGWGVHFGFRAATAVLLGLPIAGRADLAAVVDSYTTGPRRLTGGNFGPDAALFTLPLLLVGMVVLFRVTRDWAWAYTHVSIVAAGYEVTIAPPAAHGEMERTAAAPPPLVQISSATSQSRSVEGGGDVAGR